MCIRDSDYGDQAANLAAQRAACLDLVDRDHDSDGTVERVAFTVYANS